MCCHLHVLGRHSRMFNLRTMLESACYTCATHMHTAYTYHIFRAHKWHHIRNMLTFYGLFLFCFLSNFHLGVVVNSVPLRLAAE